MTSEKRKSVVMWILQVVLGILFVAVSFPKLRSQPAIVASFEQWSMPTGFHLVIGILEILFGSFLLVRRFAAYAAVGLIVIMLGAVFTHLTHAEYTRTYFPLVLIGLLTVIVYFRWPASQP